MAAISVHIYGLSYCVLRSVRYWGSSKTLFHKFCGSSVVQPSHSRCGNTKRYATSLATSQVRVRFAPSPTGHLHLGGLRTALYNYLLARSSKGSFILRIEDTDTKRLVPGATEALSDILQWAQLEPDESPLRGGPAGPYIQSQRTDYYRRYAQELLDKKDAYRCFCSPLRLELLRKASIRGREKPKYDNRCRELSEAKAEELARQGEPHSIRLKLRPPAPAHHDLVCGPVNNSLEGEGDFILLKTDGQATYHLACVVDDHLMGVTHVLRGHEWQVSTAKHLLLYRSLGWSPPLFGHLPLLINEDGSKLSKRQDSLRVEHLRSAGYTPRTLVNLVLGPGLLDRDYDAIYTLEELVDKFAVSQLSGGSARLDMERLSHLSLRDLQRTVAGEEEEEEKAVVARLRGLVGDKWGTSSSSVQEDLSMVTPQFMSNVLARCLANPVDRLHHLVDDDLRYLWAMPDTVGHLPSTGPTSAAEVLRGLVQKLEGLQKHQFTREAITGVFEEEAQARDLKLGTLLKMLRLVLCGGQRGAAIGDLLETFGRDVSLRRLGRAVELVLEVEGGRGGQ